MSKLRVYMLAKELEMDNKSLVTLLQSMGVSDVRNHMSALAPEQVERVKRHINRQADQPVVEERLQPRGGTGAVIIRRGKRKPEGGPASEPHATGLPQTGGAPQTGAPASSASGVVTRRKPEAERPKSGHSAEIPPPAPRPETRSAPVAPRPAPLEAEPVAAVSAPKHSAPKHEIPEAPEEVAADSAPSAEQLSERASERAASERAASEPSERPPSERADNAQQVSAGPELEDSVEPEESFAIEQEEEFAAPPEAELEARTEVQPVAAARVPTPVPTLAPPAQNAPAARPSSPPRTGIDVWQGRPGVPMPQPAARGNIMPRRVQYDAKPGAPAANARRGPGGPPMMGGNRRGPAPRRGIGALRGRPGSAQANTITQERSAHKKVVKIEETIALQALAAKIGVKAGQLLMKLMSMGLTGININSSLDSDTAKIVAGEFGWTVEDVAVTEDEAIALAQGDVDEEVEDRILRPPVVSVMGHVDHGKTSLLDKIRKSSVASGEAGGITQHIGAYSVKTPKGRITFLDTPGHAAFTAMRARGARCTDLVVLVVAADDGVMPQTKESVNHARDAKCPIVVAVNKIDKPEAQPERVRRELSQLGLTPEEWGGDTLFVEVSAATGKGIDELLDAILLQSEILDLRANPKRQASGIVVEAKLDRGRGPVATVLVTDGTLVKGAGLLVGSSWGRVRAMLDENGRSLSEAGPSTPVSVIGLNEVPSAGETVSAVQDAKKAQEIADTRRTKERRSQMSTTSKVSLEDLARRLSQPDARELKVIVKADVQGSVEAVHAALESLSTDAVAVNVVHSAVGAVTEGDVNLAVAAGSIIVAFNVRPAGKAGLLAQKEGIEIRQYNIIFNVIDDIKATMEGLLAPNLVEEAIGEAEVRKVFRVSKAGVVAGCMVMSGVVRRNSLVRLRRESEVIWEGKLDSLKRFKDDAKEVREGFDCGISFQGYNDLREGDIIAAFEMKEVRPTL
jgi:translation initiation factor IF-2